MTPDPFTPVDLGGPLRFDHLLHLLTIAVLGVAVVAAGAGAVLFYWRLRSPETYEERFATPVRILRWWAWAHLSWHTVCKRCGLSASEQLTRRDKDGRKVKSTRWFHPKLLEANASRSSLILKVRARVGRLSKTWNVPCPQSAMPRAPTQRGPLSPLPAHFGLNSSCGNSCRRRSTHIH